MDVRGRHWVFALAAFALAGAMAVSGCGSSDGQAESPHPEASNGAASSSSASAGPRVATRPAATSSADDPPTPADAVEFDAVVEVSQESRERMAFRGVKLRRAGNDMPVVVTYSPSPVWSDLDGLTVHVVATPYMPKGRAIMGDHMVVHRLNVVDETTARAIAGFGPTKRVEGVLREERGAPGTKAEGERQVVLQVGETAYRVYQLDLRDEDLPKGKAQFLVRSMTLSRFATHDGGPHVWIVGQPTSDKE